MPKAVTQDGVDIYYIVRGMGEPILFIHGLGESHETWSKQITFFEKSGFKVVAIDLRGHGQSSIPKKKIEMKDFAEDIFSVLRKENIEKINVVGYSMGGLVALEAYTASPSFFKALVLESTSPQYPPAQTVALENMSMDEIARQVAEFALSPLASEEEKIEVYRILSKTDKRVYIESAEAACSKSYWEELPKINVKTLIVSGELDYVCPPEVAEEMAKRIPNSKFIIFKKVGHMPHREAAEDFNRALEAFLRGETINV